MNAHRISNLHYKKFFQIDSSRR